MKKCPECEETKPLDLFYRNTSGSDGRQTICKVCRNAKIKLRNERPDVKAKKAVADKLRWQDPQSRTAQAARAAVWRKTEKGLESGRKREKRRQSNPITRAKRNKQRQARDAANRPGLREYARKRRALSPRMNLQAALSNKRHRGEHVTITVDYLMGIWNEQNGKCALSGIPMTWAPGHCGPTPTSISIDRLDPTRGYEAGNLRLLCHAINSFRLRMTDRELFEMAKALVDTMTG